MAKELPYFRFTVSEWLNDDISLEDYRLQGVFISVCAFYWFQDCNTTQAKLKKRFNDAQEEIKQLVELGIIKEVDGDFISIKFLDEQFDMLSEKRQKRVDAGRKGGLASSKQRLSNAQANGKQSSSYKDKDNNKDKDKEVSVIAIANDVPNASDSDTWQSAVRVANKLLDSICEYDPSHKYNHNPPSLKRWVKDIDLALRRDNRTEEQMIFLIEAIFKHSHKFPDLWNQWATNIESGEKLRDKFDTIKNQIKPAKNGRATKSEIDKNAELLGFTANTG